jgi:hypothetical protein
MKHKLPLVFLIFGIMIAQNLICQESNESGVDDADKKNWELVYMLGPSCSLDFFHYTSYQYGLESNVVFHKIFPPDSDKHPVTFGIQNYILYEYKNNYSELRFNNSFSINPFGDGELPFLYVGCSLLMDIFDNNIIWGVSPEISLKCHSFLWILNWWGMSFNDFFYRYNAYQNDALNRHEFGIRFFLVLDHQKRYKICGKRLQ